MLLINHVYCAYFSKLRVCFVLLLYCYYEQILNRNKYLYLSVLNSITHSFSLASIYKNMTMMMILFKFKNYEIFFKRRRIEPASKRMWRIVERICDIWYERRRLWDMEKRRRIILLSWELLLMIKESSITSIRVVGSKKIYIKSHKLIKNMIYKRSLLLIIVRKILAKIKKKEGETIFQIILCIYIYMNINIVYLKFC